MREAQRNLEEARREQSVENQTAALRKLQEAIAELEEVLRQLREEEMERVLALLEGRFRRMLEAQLKVYEGTVQIDKIPTDQRGRAVDIRANRLAYDQRKIAGDADRCLALLLEEGSSVAFPHVVEQMRDDMENVAARLDLTKVDLITQGLEEEIIEHARGVARGPAEGPARPAGLAAPRSPANRAPRASPHWSTSWPN